MKNRDMPAKPTTDWDNEFDKVVNQTNGLTKLEYAAIHIFNGMFASTEDRTWSAKSAVIAANELFDELERGE